MSRGELDPLLPQNEPSPEISDYGSSRAKSDPHLMFEAHDATSTAQPIYNPTNDNNLDHNNRQERRTVWSSVVSILSFLVLFGIIVITLYPQSSWDGHNPPPGEPRPPHHRPLPARPDPRTIEERVKVILTETPLIDGHNDLAIFIRGFYKNNITGEQFKREFEHDGAPLDVDIPRLNAGMSGGAFWSAWVVCPANASEDFSDEQYATAASHTIQQIDLLKSLHAQYPYKFTPAGTALSTMLAEFHRSRRLLGPISIEGLHQMLPSAPMSTLRLYYDLGVRAATLTWNCHNAFADAALITSAGKTKVSGRHRGGLTDRGRAVVREMNRMGMIVDISHTSYWTQKAVLSNRTSLAPVIFSHSSAFAICPHPRNVKDDILDLVKQTDSVVMVNFSPDFISCTGSGEGLPEFYEQNNTLHQVARHITYIADKIGYDHVGLGSDFDGMGMLKPRGLEGVDKYPSLIAELLKMGVSDEDAKKVVGGNVLRVWQRAERVAKEMQYVGVPPAQDDADGY